MSQSKPHSHGAVQGKLSLTHKNVGGGGTHVNNSNNQQQGAGAGSSVGGKAAMSKIQPASHRLVNFYVLNSLIYLFVFCFVLFAMYFVFPCGRYQLKTGLPVNKEFAFPVFVLLS